MNLIKRTGYLEYLVDDPKKRISKMILKMIRFEFIEK